MALRVSLLGTLEVSHDHRPEPEHTPRGIRGLLGYLFVHRERSHSRDTLAEAFWGDFDEQRARRSLNTALWRIRRVLEPVGVTRGTYLVSRHDGFVSLNTDSGLWLDVAEFERDVTTLLAVPPSEIGAKGARRLERCIEHYRGSLLDGTYDDWVLRERERLERLYVRALVHLMRACRDQGDIEASRTWAHRVLSVDPLEEGAHQELIDLYATTGQPARAALQYESYRRLLEDELAVPPSEETRSLYYRVISQSSPGGPGAGASSPRSTPAPRPTPDWAGAGLGPYLDMLDDAAQQLGEAQRTIAEALERIDRSLEGLRDAKTRADLRPS